MIILIIILTVLINIALFTLGFLAGVGYAFHKVKLAFLEKYCDDGN